MTLRVQTAGGLVRVSLQAGVGGNAGRPAAVRVQPGALIIPPPPAAPVRTVTVTGSPAEGQTLTATLSETAPAGTTYQWRRNGTNIAGATSPTFLVTAADAGTSLSVVVTSGALITTSSAVAVPAVVVPFPTGLPVAARFVADVGVTTVEAVVGNWASGASAPTVTAWADQSGNGLTATQTTANNRPVYAVDRDGRPHLRMYASFDSVLSQWLEFGVGRSFDGRNISVYIVSKQYQGFQNLLELKGYGGALVRFSAENGNTLSQTLTHANNGSTIRRRDNLTLYGVESTPTGSRAYTNDGLTSTGPLSAPAGTTTTGVRIGGQIDQADVYELVVLDGAPTTGQRDALFTYFRAKYALTSTVASLNVVTLGDSLAQGVFDDTGFRGWPTQLVRDGLRDIQTTSLAVSGNGLASYNGKDGSVNGHLVSGKRNVLLISLGRNDIPAGATGLQFYTDLKAFAQRFVATGWEVWVATVISDTGDPDFADANHRIRGSNGFPGIVADSPGVKKVLDLASLPEFDQPDDRNNRTFFQSDSTHLTQAGQAKVADFTAGQLISFVP